MLQRTIMAAGVVSAFAGASAMAGLVITEVMSQTSSGTASAVNGDWWELTNMGAAAVQLAGYQWADTEDRLSGGAPQPNFFPTITIGAGESIIILEEAAANKAAWRTMWGASASLVILGTDEMLPSAGVTDTFSGLGSGGDAVYFYDPAGALLSSFVFGAATRGVSFEADVFGNDLGLSVVGENGAVMASNGDVGSPGFAVPAPSGVMALAMAGVFASRRKR